MTITVAGNKKSTKTD
ncbi:hypothetical protein CK1_28980 [Ruminococcus sp. SR1/5]|nr:hypothetical protein CK1_28980 [Ruminococcus sp. SR1/5]